MQLDFDIRYHHGADNGNADGLSRQVWPDDYMLQMRGRGGGSKYELVRQNKMLVGDFVAKYELSVILFNRY